MRLLCAGLRDTECGDACERSGASQFGCIELHMSLVSEDSENTI